MSLASALRQQWLFLQESCFPKIQEEKSKTLSNPFLEIRLFDLNLPGVPIIPHPPLVHHKKAVKSTIFFQAMVVFFRKVRCQIIMK